MLGWLVERLCIVPPYRIIAAYRPATVSGFLCIALGLLVDLIEQAVERLPSSAMTSDIAGSVSGQDDDAGCE